ncbi:MAG: M14 family zinc carboxypeptidase, partial [Halalkalicoccus sp.]
MIRQANDSDDGRFEDAPISRRQFVRLSAVTAGALSLPGSALSDHRSEKTDDLYEFLQNHTRDSYEIPTLIRLADGSGFDALADLELAAYRETRDPEPAAYARLDDAAIDAVLDVEDVSALEHSPGANPFWKLGAYSGDVFPPSEEAVEYVGFEETEAGLTHLAEEHADRLALRSIGDSPGHHDLLAGETDPKDVWVAELTNDVEDRERFAEKEKLVYVLGIHGDERTGVEAGNRFIERVLAGEEPEVEDVLDDTVLVFLYANPDGWIVRKPQYPGQLNDFERVTATGVDPNRQYPTAGWIDPVHYPAEPNGRDLIDDPPGEVDDDVPARVVEHAPDSLDVAQHMRGYENVELFCDLHGMHWSEEFVLSLVANGQFDHEGLAEIERINRAIGEGIEAEIGSLEENMEAISLAPERYDPVREEGAELPSNEEMLPESLYDFGTIYDTIDYSTTGAFLSWAAHPESVGGLGAKSIALEMSFANTIAPMEKEYIPELAAVQTAAYLGALRAASLAVPKLSTPGISGGASTAVVTTDELTRSSDTLAFTGARAEKTRTTTEIAGGGTETVTLTVS